MALAITLAPAQTIVQGRRLYLTTRRATPFQTGIAPFAGSFSPETPLSVLNGKNSAGTWKLRVTDTAGLDVGTIFVSNWRFLAGVLFAAASRALQKW